MPVQEIFDPVPLNASGIVSAESCIVGGFFCCTAGTVTLRNGPSGTDAVMVPTFPVTAGVWHSLPFSFGRGCYADLAGGATGVFGII